MKLSEAWLREWVNPKLTREELSYTLTMAGLEVESVTSFAELLQKDSSSKQNDHSPINDYSFDITITPNRGDCLSIKGIANEVAALTKTPLTTMPIPSIKPRIKDTIPVRITAKEDCPRYTGRIIRMVKVDSTTPKWLKEKLYGSGIRSIHPIVDITNYVMLELGQPMHAFDLDKIQQEMIVRQSKQGECITLLDGNQKELDGQTLVIADQNKPLAIAGVMGGLNSSVTLNTHNIFLESAYFSPKTIARQRQFYDLNSESAYRFERNIDPTIQTDAIERATQLILEIMGGNAGPIIEVLNKKYIPTECIITIISENIEAVLGVAIPSTDIDSILQALQFRYQKKNKLWIVHIPPHRPDILIPEDLIEEIARLYGYEKIPTQHAKATLQISQPDKNSHRVLLIRQTLQDRGYHEIISYSFVDKKLQLLLNSQETPYELLNPITTDMSVMRTNLWPGLVQTLIYNQNRQQNRIRLFEIGTCFNIHQHTILQQSKLAGLIAGPVYSEQWGMAPREVDFYDAKGDIETILHLFYRNNEYEFRRDKHPACHPGQTAGIYIHDKKIGMIGTLHPTVIQTMDLPKHVYVYELDLLSLQKVAASISREPSKFPEIRRDIAILIDQTIPAKDIQDTIRRQVGAWLKDIYIFDIYQGKGIAPGFKSIALALILQHPTRTLIDEEILELMNQVTTALKKHLGAILRS
ncbi:MAG TPA: phenylalanine--tRNA ligase subunit beta [Gammaproteobacteria bacterium]|nr:phenylalanine--tRNA ligase subunit beta [Gammaproteobacteria bacterium]